MNGCRDQQQSRLPDLSRLERRPAPLEKARQRILPFSTNGWDAWQADGGVALADTRWDGNARELEKFDGTILAPPTSAAPSKATKPTRFPSASPGRTIPPPRTPGTRPRAKSCPVTAPTRRPQVFEQKTLYKKARSSTIPPIHSAGLSSCSTTANSRTASNASEWKPSPATW